MTLMSNRFLFVLLTSLYFSQGLPSGLLAHGMPAIMREYGSSLTAIGMLKLLALPWLFKFLWAPLLDRYQIQRLGPHRSWILVMQTGAISVMFLLSFLSPEWLFSDGLICLFILLFLVNLFSSTQDIATDGLAVTMLPEKLRGLGNSVQVCGYKIGLMLGGSGLLILINDIGWMLSVQLVALTLILMLLPTLRFNEIEIFKKSHSTALEMDGQSSTIKGQGAYDFWSFFKKHNIFSWVLVLVTFKIADSMSSTLVKPMLIDFDLSLSQVGEITLVASLVGLAGAVMAGWLYTKIRPVTLLVVFTLLQAVSISAYSFIPNLFAVNDASLMSFIYLIVVSDQVIDTMSTVVLFAVMMSHCREGHEGGDYTVQACLQVFSAGIVGVLAGIVADQIQSYQLMFFFAGGSALISLFAVYLYKRSQSSISVDRNAFN